VVKSQNVGRKDEQINIYIYIIIYYNGGFLKWGYPQIIHFNISIINHPFWDTPISGNPYLYGVYNLQIGTWPNGTSTSDVNHCRNNNKPVRRWRTIESDNIRLRDGTRKKASIPTINMVINCDHFLLFLLFLFEQHNLS
jgi:hypothetical protein